VIPLRHFTFPNHQAPLYPSDIKSRKPSPKTDISVEKLHSSYRRRLLHATLLVHGAAIQLACVIDFTDGYKGDRFTVEIVKRRGRNRTNFRAPNGCLYRIRNLDAIGYSVVSDPA
jgi:hypothetical protein